MAVLKTSVTAITPRTLNPGASTTLDDCIPVDLTRATQLLFTFRGKFAEGATAGAKITLWPSYDGHTYDTAPWSNAEGEPFEWEIPAEPGRVVVRTSEPISPTPKYLKVKVENLDQEHAITECSVMVTVQTVG